MQIGSLQHPKLKNLQNLTTKYANFPLFNSGLTNVFIGIWIPINHIFIFNTNFPDWIKLLVSIIGGIFIYITYNWCQNHIYQRLGYVKSNYKMSDKNKFIIRMLSVGIAILIIFMFLVTEENSNQVFTLDFWAVFIGFYCAILGFLPTFTQEYQILSFLMVSLVTPFFYFFGLSSIVRIEFITIMKSAMFQVSIITGLMFIIVGLYEHKIFLKIESDLKKLQGQS